MQNLPARAMGFRTSVMALQHQHEQLPQVDCQLKHYFANGAYVREVTIPAGTIVIGKIHKHETINILLKGEITVVTEEGSQRLVAPCTFIAPPGNKKAAYTHSEVIWQNVIATTSTDPDEIERDATCESYEDGGFLEHVNAKLAGIELKLEALCR